MNDEDLGVLDGARKSKAVFSYEPFWRNRWYLLAPLFLLGVASYVVAEYWPLLYRSEALIVIEGQKVPEQYVTPNVVSTLRYRLESMSERILSRTRLQQLIEEFGLYQKERSRMSVEDVIDNMRRNITVEVTQDRDRPGDIITGIRVSFVAREPRVAQRVTNEITSMLIEESLRSRTQQSLSTTAFLTSQLEQARKNLQDQEAQLRQYKSQFIGELPEQEQSNLQILSGLEAQLYTVSSALARADQQRVYLEAMKAQYARPDGSPKASPLDKKITIEHTAAEEGLNTAVREYEDAKTRYTEEYPRLEELKQEIADWRARIAELDKRAAAASAAEASASTAPSAAEIALAEIESRLKAVAKEIADYKADEESLQARIRDIQSRVSLTPVREQQLADVTRTYENSKANYESLLQKKTQSELASNLETRQQGEQFRVLDPASLPHRPEGRIFIIVAGWAAGLCLGIGLLVMRTTLDQTIRGKDDVAAVTTELPIIVRIPLIATARERGYKRVFQFAEVVTLLLLIAASIAGAVRTYLTV